MSRRAKTSLALIWAAGIATILASSLEEEEPFVPPEPVNVAFTLASLANPLTRTIDTRVAELDDLLVTGDYRANKGARLTLDRTSLTLDLNTRFTIRMTATDPDETLDGTADFSVTDPLDVGIDHNPVGGQFQSVYRSEDGDTTTLVTVTGSGVNVAIGGAMQQSLNWSDFEAREDDSNAEIDLRLASAAYNMIETVLRVTLLTENIVDDVEQNKTMLESLGLLADPPLSLDCDNTQTQGEGESVLLWTADPPGAGAGSVGANDGFEARYENCRDAGSNRFLQNNVSLSSYNPADSSGFSVFGVAADFSELFVSETETSNLTAVPRPTSPRIDGGLSLLYVETADAP